MNVLNDKILGNVNIKNSLVILSLFNVYFEFNLIIWLTNGNKKHPMFSVHNIVYNCIISIQNILLNTR